MKRQNNLAVAAVLVGLLALVAVFVFLRPGSSPGPSEVQAPESSETPASRATAPQVAAPTPPGAGEKSAEPSTAEKPAETPAPADGKASEGKAADASPPEADKAEDKPAPAEEKTADAPAPAGDKTAEAPAPAEQKTPEAPAPAEQKTEAAPAQPADVPSFDVVRIEPTGDGVIAGRAAPGWRISVDSGGMQVAMAEADDQGEWTVILDRPLAPGRHTLSLRATSPDGARHSSSTQTVSAEVATPPTKTAVADTPKRAPAQAPAAVAARSTPATPEIVPEDRDVPPGRVPPDGAAPLPQTAAIQEGKATPPSSLSPQDRPGTYTILPGDTLWDIAQRYLGAGWRYKSIYRDNRKIIRNPNLIYPEQRMEIPEPSGEAN